MLVASQKLRIRTFLMSQKNIKIKIGGRTYPLTLSQEEEESVNGAVKRIEQNIAKLKNQYGISDSQDLLAMTSLELATQLENSLKTNNNQHTDDLSNDLDKIIEKLDTVIS